MITIHDLVKNIRYKYITFNNEKYCVMFSLTHDYSIDLYKKYEDRWYSSLMNIYEDEDENIKNIQNNYKLEFSEKLVKILAEVNKDENICHSPTYIQKIIETFFNKYLDHLKAKEENEKETQLQIDNFNNWNGVIE